MAKRTGMEVSLAVSEAVKMAKTDVIAAYPITPQTHIVEHLADLVANGELDAEYIPVESEHSAMAACIAASLTGVRTFTATSSQGIALMHEMLHFAAGCRAPVVLVNVNRLLAAPWGFWADQLDSLLNRLDILVLRHPASVPLVKSAIGKLMAGAGA